MYFVTIAPKKYLIMRHSERVDVVYPEWAATAERSYDTPITDNLTFFNANINGIDYFVGKKIYCSPFKRCIQTAQMISELFNPKLQICLEPALIEVSSIKFYINNDYFENEEIYKRHPDVNFDTTYKPFMSHKDINEINRKKISHKDLKNKLINLLRNKDSCICVAHREFINIIDSTLPDNYCDSVLVDKNLNIIF